jgi:hypothetical protein
VVEQRIGHAVAIPKGLTDLSGMMEVFTGITVAAALPGYAPSGIPKIAFALGQLMLCSQVQGLFYKTLGCREVALFPSDESEVL